MANASTANNWEVWHESTWTGFELHSAILGTLRKQFTGEYLVRGRYRFITKNGIEYCPDIAIFKVVNKGIPAKLLLTIEVVGSKSSVSRPDLLGVPMLLITDPYQLKTIGEEVRKTIREGSNHPELAV